MAGIDNLGSSKGNLTVADILEESFESPIELASSMSEGQIRDRLTKLFDERAAVDAEIALLQSRRRRLRSQAFLAQDALRIAADKGLE